MKNSHFFIFSFILLSLACTKINALTCYRCNSKTNSNCGDNFNPSGVPICTLNDGLWKAVCLVSYAVFFIIFFLGNTYLIRLFKCLKR
jgi:hypothetical protein